MEVWLTLAGVLFFFRGPVVGSMHDAKIYKRDTSVRRTPLFTHHQDKMFLVDLGYTWILYTLQRPGPAGHVPSNVPSNVSEISQVKLVKV